MRDLAGGAREWCADEGYFDQPHWRPVRGGSWASNPRYSRLATRYGVEPLYISTQYGLGLVRPAPA